MTENTRKRQKPNHSSFCFADLVACAPITARRRTQLLRSPSSILESTSDNVQTLVSRALRCDAHGGVDRDQHTVGTTLSRAMSDTLRCLNWFGVHASAIRLCNPALLRKCVRRLRDYYTQDDDASTIDLKVSTFYELVFQARPELDPQHLGQTLFGANTLFRLSVSNAALVWNVVFPNKPIDGTTQLWCTCYHFMCTQGCIDLGSESLVRSLSEYSQQVSGRRLPLRCVRQWLEGVKDWPAESPFLELVQRGSVVYVKTWFTILRDIRDWDVLGSLSMPSMHRTEQQLLQERECALQELYDRQESCSICLEKMCEDPPVSLLDSCRHAFHSECIAEWQSENDTCPLCRRVMEFEMLCEHTQSWNEWYEENQATYTLDATQREVVVRCLAGNFNVISGPGGSGKTRIASAIATYLRDTLEDSSPCVILAPTGTAACMMRGRMRGDGITVSTIHSWILRCDKYLGPSFVPYLFIDESSMVDLWVLWHILCASKRAGVQKIVFLGDHFQLPPIQKTGTLLSACIAVRPPLGCVHILTSIYRTSNPALDAILSHIRTQLAVDDSRRGARVPRVLISPAVLAPFVHRVPTGDVPKLQETILSILGTCDPSDTRLVTARRHGVLPDGKSDVDTARFLHNVQQFFNFVPTRSLYGGRCRGFGTIHAGDKVYSMRNIRNRRVLSSDPKWNHLMVGNGTEGRVTCAQPLTVQFDTGYVVCEHDPTLTLDEEDMLHHLHPAYLRTVHSFQGSEKGTIIAVFTGSYDAFHTAELLYTALSRAKHTVHLVMEECTHRLYCERGAKRDVPTPLQTQLTATFRDLNSRARRDLH